MAVGARFNDPETQAAIAAQGGTPAEPEVKPDQSTSQVQVPATETDTDLNISEPKVTPDAAKQDNTPAEIPEPKVEPAQKKEDLSTYIYESLAEGDAEKGKANFATLADWCSKNLSKDEVAAINYLLRSDDKAVVRQGLTQAVNAWKKGKTSPMMTGDSLPTNSPKERPTFQPLSKDEFIEIMMTPKYQTDPAYAKEIDARRQATIDQQGGIGYVSPEFSHSRRPLR